MAALPELPGLVAMMDTWDEEDRPDRNSPMAYNGGLKIGRDRRPVEWRDYDERRRDRPVVLHPGSSRDHPPLYCPKPRYNEPWRGYRCPACGRKMHHELNVYDAHEAADRALATAGRALVAVHELVRDLPRWAEVTVGVVLVVFPVAGWLAANGWMRMPR